MSDIKADISEIKKALSRKHPCDAVHTSVDRVEAALTAFQERVAGLEKLLERAWMFPDCPTPGEGMVSTTEDIAAEDGWREEYDKLDAEVRAALAVGGGK